MPCQIHSELMALIDDSDKLVILVAPAAIGEVMADCVVLDTDPADGSRVIRHDRREVSFQHLFTDWKGSVKICTVMAEAKAALLELAAQAWRDGGEEEWYVVFGAHLERLGLIKKGMAVHLLLQVYYGRETVHWE